MDRLFAMRRQVGAHQLVYVRHHAERILPETLILRVEDLDAELARVVLLLMPLDWANQI